MAQLVGPSTPIVLDIEGSIGQQPRHVGIKHGGDPLPCEGAPGDAADQDRKAVFLGNECLILRRSESVVTPRSTDEICEPFGGKCRGMRPHGENVAGLTLYVQIVELG